MKKLIILFLTSLVMIMFIPSIIAGVMLQPEDLNFIDKVIMWLENLDLDGLHATLSTVVALLLILLRIFQKRIKKALD